jgi:uncharacterized damage-inducible protein DinB
MAVIEGFRIEFLKYKALAEKAIAQLDGAQLSAVPPGGGNSIATICWHVAGNLRSRFTDFLTSDGEKPWRARDEEFEAREVTKAELLEKWETGWTPLVGALDGIDDSHLETRITIRGESMSVLSALLRSLAHTSSHVGQILYAAKMLKGADWTYLSIPPGQSETFNRDMRGESRSPESQRPKVQSPTVP